MGERERFRMEQEARVGAAAIEAVAEDRGAEAERAMDADWCVRCAG